MSTSLMSFTKYIYNMNIRLGGIPINNSIKTTNIFNTTGDTRGAGYDYLS